MVVVVGFAFHDAAESDVAIKATGTAQGEADDLGKFVGAGDVEGFEGGAGLAEDALGAPGQAIDDLGVVGGADQKQMGGGPSTRGAEGSAASSVLTCPGLWC